MKEELSRSLQRGLSLIELIVFIVIVGVALVGVLSVLNWTAANSATPMVRKQVVAVAEGLMEEILAKDYANPSGGYSGADRASFDDVGDYNGWSQTGVTAIDGSAITGLETYVVSVAVVAATVGGSPMKQITVTVVGGGETFDLIGYRANYL